MALLSWRFVPPLFGCSFGIWPVLFGLGCDAAGAGSEAVISTTGLWPAPEGTLYTLRMLTAGAAAGDDTATFDEASTLLAYVEAGGCAAGDGVRLALRAGVNWAAGTPEGAFHFAVTGAEASEGFALCGYETSGGTVVFLDSPLPLWDGNSVADGGTVSAGEWSISSTSVAEQPTYYGIFRSAARFEVSHVSGTPANWSITLAPQIGMIVLQTETYTADLVDVR